MPIVYTEIENLLLQVVVLGALQLLSRVIFRRPIISASLSFWVAWVFLIGGAKYSETASWIEINNYSFPYLSIMLYGAFCGFSVGLFFSFRRKNSNSFEKLTEQSRILVNRFLYPTLILLFVTGVIFLLQRILEVGLTNSFLADVRAVHNVGDASLLLRLGSHLYVLGGFFVTLLGVRDSRSHMNLRTLAMTIAAASPMGFANGGRIFLLNYFLIYVSSLLLCRANYVRMRPLLSRLEKNQLSLMLLSILLIFSVLGFVRGGYGEDLNILFNIIIWPVSTFTAMDSWVFQALTSARTSGLNTFGWLFGFLERLNFINLTSENQVMMSVVDSFADTNNSARFIPRSILPDLIFDFGKNGIFWGMLLISAILEAITTRLPGRGIFFHVLAVQCLLGSFFTIQTSIVTPVFVVPIFWGFVGTMYFRIKRS